MEKRAPYKQRLFFALALPPLARAHVVAWQGEMLGHYGRELRLVRPEALHVTIVFLGNVAADPIGHVREGAFNAVGDGPAELEAIGVKPVPPRHPRLWALALADHGGRASDIHARVADGLAAKGLYSRDERPFWPHVTVARLRAGAKAQRVEVPPPPIRFTANELVLYRSHVSRSGSEYERIATRDLGPARR